MGNLYLIIMYFLCIHAHMYKAENSTVMYMLNYIGYH